MSKKLLMAALTVFAVTAVSAGGEVAADPTPIIGGQRSLAMTQDVRPGAENLLGAFYAEKVESADSHIVKTGVWSSIKNGAKKVGGAVTKAAKTVASGAKTAATRIGAGYKRVAVDIAKSKVGKTVAKVAKEGAKKVSTTVKKLLFPKKAS